MRLDFEIDKLTESIENAQTGESLETLVIPIIFDDLKDLTKKNGWKFDWKLEFADNDRQVCKLVSKKEPNIIQGLVSFEKNDGFVYLHLIENSSINIGSNKKYIGVAGNLIAFVCKMSVGYGFEGVVVFEPKTALIPHYEKTLGAVLIGNRRMAIFEENAKVLINMYFNKKE